MQLSKRRQRICRHRGECHRLERRNVPYIYDKALRGIEYFKDEINLVYKELIII